MRHKHAHAREALLPELAPETLIEAADAIVRVRGALAVRDAVEEVPVVGALLPHPRHLRGRGLEVAEILFAQAGLLVDFDVLSREGRGGGGGGGQGGEDAFGGFARAPVGGGEEVEGVGGAQEGAEFAPGGVGLRTAFWGELDAVVGDGLVDVAVFWGGSGVGELDGEGWRRTVSFGLGVAH